MTTRLCIGLALVTGLAATVVGNGILVVNVEQDGSHVVVPVPLVLARPVAAVLPAAQSRIPCPELGPYRDLALRAVRELAAADDAELVRVEEPAQTVSIRKERGQFEVRVDERAQQVLVRIPAAAVEEILAGYDGEAFRAVDLAAATRHLTRGDVVRVVNGNERVRISVW